MSKLLINDFQTTQSGGATSGATSIAVAAAVPGVGASDTVRFRNARTGEIFDGTANLNTTTWTIARAVEDSSRWPAAAMLNGDVLEAVPTNALVQAPSITGPLSLGTNPAASGSIRLANADWIVARNAANGGDLNLLRANASDQAESGRPWLLNGTGTYGIDLSAGTWANAAAKFPNGVGIYWRNGANTNDINGLYVASNDLMALGFGCSYVAPGAPLYLNGVSGVVLEDRVGDNLATYAVWDPRRWALYEGTAAAPITAAGPTVKISKVENISTATMGGNQVDNECNAVVRVIVENVATSQAQLCAIMGTAEGMSTTAGSDIVGLYGIGRVTGSGVGIGCGLFVEGRRDTATGTAQGTEIHVTNETTTDGVFVSNGIGTAMGAWVTGSTKVVATALTAIANPGDTTLTVTSTTGFPTSGTLTLGATGAVPAAYEVVTYTGVTGTTFTGVTRARELTTAGTWASTTAVHLRGKLSSAIGIGSFWSVDGSGPFKVGFHAIESSVSDQTFRDDSWSNTSVIIQGKHQWGLDTAGSTMTSGAIRVGNAQAIVSKKADLTTDANILYLNGTNNLILGEDAAGVATQANVPVALDGTTLYVDAATNHYVGVGTSIPAAKLHVTGPGQAVTSIRSEHYIANGAAAPIAFEPYVFSTIVSATDQPVAQQISAGLMAECQFGGAATSPVAAQGTAVSLSSVMVVRGNGNNLNEHSPIACLLRYDIGTGYPVTTTPGRAWMTDFGVHGPVAVQPHLLNGLSMFTNNYYNGNPADTPSGAIWISTLPGAGPGRDEGHGTTSPPGAPTLAVGSATGLTGAYRYKITFVNAFGETQGGTTAGPISVTNQKINLTAIPLGPLTTTARKIYRTLSGGADGTQKLVTTLADNTTTTYTDSIADGSLTTAVPVANTTTVTTYPMNVGLGIVGWSSGGNGQGFNTGIQIGGSGSGWTVLTSKFGTGIDLRDYVNYGLYIHARDTGGTGPGIQVDDTWNSAATAFVVQRFNVTDTASRADSLLADYQKAGVSQFRIDKFGNTFQQGIDFTAASWLRMWDYVTTSAATVTLGTPGFAAVTQTSGTAATNQKNARGEWLRISTTTTNNNAASLVRAFTNTQLQAGPVFFTTVEIPTITSVRVQIGLFSAALVAGDSEATISTLHFRFTAGTDTNWAAFSSNGTTQTAATTTNLTQVAVAANTKYILCIDARDNANVRFYVNGTLVAIATATLPAAATGLGVIQSVTTLTTAQRDLHISETKIYQ